MSCGCGSKKTEQKADDPCKCGSGKKTKECCGE
ncbi:SEC-C domain-containing protein [Candidatus Bathyarchaeota archaeon]|nr:SEC-C domain-containing protein [Candidatus Bathyarchaeota archaeon]